MGLQNRPLASAGFVAATGFMLGAAVFLTFLASAQGKASASIWGWGSGAFIILGVLAGSIQLSRFASRHRTLKDALCHKRAVIVCIN